MKIKANDIDIEVEDSGGSGPVVLLVMGLGKQLTAWPDSLVRALAGAGYRVLRHDNRDIGLSQHFDDAGTPSVPWSLLRLRLGLALRVPYTLGEMAQDSLGVLDALGVRQAHVVGVSMGGMIAQRMAIAAPERVASLTSVMSSSGARGLPEARPEVMRAILSTPKTREAALAHSVRVFQLIGSPAFPIPAAELRERAAGYQQRAFHPQGVTRQLLAIGTDARRAEQLARVTTPALVLHGRDDPLVPLACGEDTARRIPGARLHVIDGMGHDLPEGVVERLLPPLLDHLTRHPVPASAP